MLKFKALNLAAFLLSLVLPAAACVAAPPQTSSNPSAQNKAAADSNEPKGSGEAAGREATQDTKGAADKRVAALEIEGCPREQTTFFSGEVRFFKRTKDALEITVHTDWNSTAKLVQPKDNPEVIFRRDGKELADEDVRGLEVALRRGESQYRVTVWVCRDDGQKVIKLIEWSEAEGASKLPGSAPRRH
jgi:hypothetical protein